MYVDVYETESVIALLRRLMQSAKPYEKTVVVAPTMRRAKEVWTWFEDDYVRNRDSYTLGRPDSGSWRVGFSRDIDRTSLVFNNPDGSQSQFVFLPLGDGSRVRAMRAHNYVIVDRHLMDKDAHFVAVSGVPDKRFAGVDHAQPGSDRTCLTAVRDGKVVGMYSRELTADQTNGDIVSVTVDTSKFEDGFAEKLVKAMKNDTGGMVLMPEPTEEYRIRTTLYDGDNRAVEHEVIGTYPGNVKELYDHVLERSRCTG
jgi:hypothetical protein